MKKYLLFFLSTPLFPVAHAQTDSAVATATYKLSHLVDTTQPGNPFISKKLLLLGSTTTVYMNDPATAGPRLLTIDGVAQPLQPVTMEQMFRMAGSMFRDMAGGVLTAVNSAGGKTFLVEETTPIDWKIAQDTKEILGLTCQKATGHFRGRDYEVWFTSQLPYNSGPWKLNGLPGLILEASDVKKEVVFTIESFQSQQLARTVIAYPPNATKVSKKEFTAYQDAIMKDRRATVGSSAVISPNGNITVSGTVSPGVSLRSSDGKPMRKMNNPMEKEEIVRNN